MSLKHIILKSAYSYFEVSVKIIDNNEISHQTLSGTKLRLVKRAYTMKVN